VFKLGIRTPEQLEDALGCLEVELAAEHLAAWTG
jgi:aryl-alcohol dehydrogenase-like predicted oxidoreductase